MIRVTLQQLATALNATLLGEDVAVETVCTDTRKLTPGCLFIALRDEKFDAHDYAHQAVRGGAAALLVSKHLPIDVPQLLVGDTRLALGELGAWMRRQSSARVVALTGSSGKTSVKEMTAAILRQCGDVLYTDGNFNNDIGVPLTLLRLTLDHRFAVIELGANHIGEIAYATNLVRPDSALVNNLAAAHLEGFGSLDGVARAKGEIFNGLPTKGIAVINADSNDLTRWHDVLRDKTVWQFSPQQGEYTDYYASDIRNEGGGSLFELHTPFGALEINVPLPGRHNVANALAAAALAMSVGAGLQQVKDGLAQLKAVPGRLFPIMLAAKKLLLDDSYNANVGSMTAAVHTLAEMPGYRVLVVGDMGELGEDAEACHQKVGEVARDAGIDTVLSIGTLSQAISLTSERGEHFSDRTALIARLQTLLSAHGTISILVKGSRSSAMEHVVHALQENTAC
ncbi:MULTISPECIES: UDP-N-acetylmuramoyl-tripeptide--D-alanyl-D-alanine ligase [Symbiopectobacterium]|uniref:UDP-N-acetylmuramoyl-tripeptide--D-alanyl-D- alanine ligase n=1 Tax=Symbiopectobacterium TaxID=801 RepID=UPI001A35F14D|nr:MULTISPECIES: UDP-N-acetylmuramoyl-tripeptide--D-alanyl-D-alanine ligase [Symbiopectobacterium]MBG6248967.1 UDP-N-acetylmuramoyl-tripeptide--D-alanyl-D-alanine ligase [Candidatus Symbiopectobacterium sp. PLON1]MBT9429016.1 UDP-N-acetylmuramoyl-tripeptide--D-alanyl-D-alanine ligase [Candidatus Symbiopectobacterium endolongispinus]